MLALLVPSLELDQEQRAVRLTLRMGSGPPLVLPLGVGSRPQTSSSLNVCGKDCDAVDCGGALVSQWLSEALKVQCRLVRHCVSTAVAPQRHMAAGAPPRSPLATRDAPCDDEEHASAHHSAASTSQIEEASAHHSAAPTSQIEEASAARVAFANEAPLLVLAHSAVEALNASLRAVGHAPVSARHFRPNLVLDGEGLHTALEPAPEPALEPFEVDEAEAEDGSSAVLSAESAEMSKEAEDGSSASPPYGAEAHDALATPDRRPEIVPEIVLADGRVVLRVTSACARCAMVEIDPVTLPTGCLACMCSPQRLFPQVRHGRNRSHLRSQTWHGAARARPPPSGTLTPPLWRLLCAARPVARRRRS
jgi:hypothetical protein